MIHDIILVLGGSPPYFYAKPDHQGEEMKMGQSSRLP